MNFQRIFSPANIVIISFLVVIAIGTVLLLLPFSTVSGKINLLDAIFTATSATCVTGLVVLDTGSYFTLFGQIVILLLIQIGGLGLMTLSTFFLVIIGKKISLKEKLVIKEGLNQLSIGGIVEFLKLIFIFTFGMELLGAILLYIFLSPNNFFAALFHSISAFCNAGFSLFQNSLVDFRGNIPVNLIMSGLIISGGLGFFVHLELKRRVLKQIRNLSLHTKIVLKTTLFLILGGTVIIFLFEHNGVFSQFTLKEKLLCSFFQAVTARTAGFNTVDIQFLNTNTLIFLIFLMFIGASPGSTGGGIKTTTFATVTLLVFNIIKGKTFINVSHKRISVDAINRAIGLTILAIVLVLVSSLILFSTEKYAREISIPFEVVSAFGTVGLSTGITPSLSTVGKLVIIITMFIGRVGPLSLILAITELKSKEEFKLPEERISIG